MGCGGGVGEEDGVADKNSGGAGGRGEVKTLREGGKTKSEDGAQRSVWRCGPKPGIVRVTFDNTYSRLRSKTIKYKFELSAEEDENDGEEGVGLADKVEKMAVA